MRQPEGRLTQAGVSNSNSKATWWYETSAITHTSSSNCWQHLRIINSLGGSNGDSMCSCSYIYLMYQPVFMCSPSTYMYILRVKHKIIKYYKIHTNFEKFLRGSMDSSTWIVLASLTIVEKRLAHFSCNNLYIKAEIIYKNSFLSYLLKKRSFLINFLIIMAYRLTKIYPNFLYTLILVKGQNYNNKSLIKISV